MEKKAAPERIEELRGEIDRIDGEFIALFERRMDIAAALGRIKRENGMNIKNSSREQQVRENCRANCKNDRYAPWAENVIMHIIDACRGIQDEDAAKEDAVKQG